MRTDDSTTATELFDPQFLSRLRTLFFKLRKRRKLERKGAQSTPASGFTREFKDHRDYTPGDDYRTIDWRLFARLEKLFIRIFEEVQEFHIHILIDRSQSMAEPFGDKRVLALRLAVALAYLGLTSQHRVSILSLGDSIERETAPLKGQGHIHNVLKHLAALRFGGKTDLVGSLKKFRPGRDRRGIVFLISDLFGREPELSPTALQQARSWPAETHVIHIYDPRERRPEELEGDIRLVDVETEELRRIWITKRELERYEKAFDAYTAALQQTCMKQQTDYLQWTTERSFEEMFVSLLERGSSLARG